MPKDAPREAASPFRSGPGSAEGRACSPRPNRSGDARAPRARGPSRHAGPPRPSSSAGIRCDGRGDSRRPPERLGEVGALPGKVRQPAPEVTERRGLLVDRAAEIEARNDAVRRELEVLAYE